VLAVRVSAASKITEVPVAEPEPVVIMVTPPLAAAWWSGLADAMTSWRGITA
jgi:hypothetical protein